MKARTAAVGAAVLAVAAIALWRFGHAEHPEIAGGSAAGSSAQSAAAGGSAMTTAGSAGDRTRPPALAAAIPVAGSAAAATDDAGAAHAGSSDIYQRGAVVTPRVRELEALIKKLVHECWDNVHAQRPDVRGELKMTVKLAHDPQIGNLIATADVDNKATTVTDHELLQCATANVFAAEELLDQLRADKDPTGGNIVFHFELTFPPPPDVPEDWPADSASPVCAPPATVKGKQGEQQWCELPDGTKDGDDYVWDKGKLTTIVIYKHGASSSVRFAPPGR